MRSRTEGADCVSSGERQTERRLPPPTARLGTTIRGRCALLWVGLAAPRVGAKNRETRDT